MSTLRQAVADYLAMRQTMGFKAEGLSKLLASFVGYCEARNVDHVRNDIALEWATSQIKVPVTDALVARRMDAVRIFARHQQTLDPATQIPPEKICTRRYRSREPNVLDPAEVMALLAATQTLSPKFRALTWRTLVGLLAVTGMRPGEACHLHLKDVDLTAGVIQVLETKFGKSRLVFLHPTTTDQLSGYRHARQKWATVRSSNCPAFFLNTRGGTLAPEALSRTFNKIVAASGLTTAPGHRAPRLHDLRHTFAVTTLLDWYRDGRDVQARLPLLSTWLGHIDPVSTYWYLHAVPQLLALAAGRLQAPHGPITQSVS